MIQNRFNIQDEHIKIVPIRIEPDRANYISKLSAISLTFQYYSLKYLGKKASNQSFYDILTNVSDGDEHRKKLGMENYNVSSRVLQRILSGDKIDYEFVNQIVLNKSFQNYHNEAYNFYFYSNPERLKRPVRRFYKMMKKFILIGEF